MIPIFWVLYTVLLISLAYRVPMRSPFITGVLFLRALTVAHLVSPTIFFSSALCFPFPAGAALDCLAYSMVVSHEKVEKLFDFNAKVAIACFIITTLIIFAFMDAKYRSRKAQSDKSLERDS